MTAAQASKKVLNNAETKYFKWEMETRNLLLLEAHKRGMGHSIPAEREGGEGYMYPSQILSKL